LETDNISQLEAAMKNVEAALARKIGKPNSATWKPLISLRIMDRSDEAAG